MSYVNAVIEDKAAFMKALDTPLPVFMVFMSHDCPACTDALPRFVELTKQHPRQIKVLILDCTNTPKHGAVDRIPMLLVYKHGELLETLPGLGKQPLEEVFKKYG